MGVGVVDLLDRVVVVRGCEWAELGGGGEGLDLFGSIDLPDEWRTAMGTREGDFSIPDQAEFNVVVLDDEGPLLEYSSCGGGEIVSTRGHLLSSVAGSMSVELEYACTAEGQGCYGDLSTPLYNGAVTLSGLVLQAEDGTETSVEDHRFYVQLGGVICH